MQRCSPVRMRSTLEVADMFKKSGIYFICVPVISHESEKELIELSHKNLSVIVDIIEKSEKE